MVLAALAPAVPDDAVRAAMHSPSRLKLMATMASTFTDMPELRDVQSVTAFSPHVRTYPGRSIDTPTAPPPSLSFPRWHIYVPDTPDSGPSPLSRCDYAQISEGLFDLPSTRLVGVRALYTAADREGI
ncbi:hypothetical protein SCP_1600210 [Sparassis crispa]|uniref:Uncharacterized protein n=1 Tax=Sparassis crispa TaxID=139825 RepID=A0A401H4T2_9APHY|nr:hypothetical protein SCP_1600210 [Sparassis crispa]GBE89360.1 hypothetical protein SCP_1600210 [Sparassis crispa]